MLYVFVLIVLVIAWLIFRSNEFYVIPVPAYNDMPIDSRDEVDDHHMLQDPDEELDDQIIQPEDEQVHDHNIFEHTDDHVDVHYILEDTGERVDVHYILEQTGEQIGDRNILEGTEEQIVDYFILKHTDEENTGLTEDNIPSVFIIEDFLPSTVKTPTVNDCQPFGFESEFMIDGIVYKEKLETEQFRHFELYANYNNMDEYADNNGVSIEDDTPLKVIIETAPNGMIINGNVYLTDQQWNTLVYISDSTLSCAVCGTYCDLKHMQLDTHKANLEKCQPLDKYDLSITRKIDSFYHCAVCNLIFHESQNESHFSGKEHENKLLFAINKVSDIMYDFNIHNENNNVIKNDTYHYNARAINNDSISESDDELPRGSRYDAYAYSVRDSGDETEQDDENFYDHVDPPLNLACSYATMARKPKTDELPAILEIDLGNKTVKVKSDSWNMVISPKENMFYCMVCTKFDHVRRKSKHCLSEEHVKKLALCKVVEQYEKYLVRQVDDKLYHCGHCNNLQLINEMEDHIEAQHPPTKNTSHLDSPAKRLPSVNHELKISPKPINVARNENETMKDNQPKMVNAMNLNMYRELRAVNSNLNEDIVICTFGKTVSISKLAYNIVCGQVGEFYCGLCEVNINRQCLSRHVNDLQHLILLQGTPFIQEFNIHLYRRIRDALHCALCNQLIPLIPDFIFRHKIEPTHMLCVAKALGRLRNVSAIEAEIKHEKKVIRNDLNDFNVAEKPKTVASPVKVGTKQKDPQSVKESKKVNTQVATIKDGKFDETEVIAPTPKFESTEFIEVKNGLKDQGVDEEQSDPAEELDDSTVEPEFDFEEHLYVQINNCYIKISNSSYHTLVKIGDGSNYCFVCSIVVYDHFKKHVESRGHAENMEKYNFVDKYKDNLFRQIYLMYHCGVCNVLIARKHVNHHLSWPTHLIQAENSKLSSKQRKAGIKAGTQQVTANTQIENIYLNETETKIKIILNISIRRENEVSVVRKNKIIIFNDNVLKISFNAWHSLSPLENSWKCTVCQTEFQEEELPNHVACEWHTDNLNKFEEQYSPALIRKVNDTILNCIMCNTEMSHKQHIVKEHIQGKKHLKNYENILTESSAASNYADCDGDVITLG